MDKVLSLIGLARRAGKVVSGEFSTENAVKDGKAFLVITASDASPNTKKLFRDKCASHHTVCFEYADKAALGRALGQEERASLAILDQGFAEAVKKLLTD